MSLRRPSLRDRLERMAAEAPFLRLVQHFAQRAVGGGDTASQIDLGIGGALVLFAIPGAFTSIGLLDKYSSLLNWARGIRHFDAYRACIPDEYFFIIYSMAVTGLVTVLRWDHLLPGRRDYVNLAPLPLNLRSIFLASVVALASTAFIFAIDVNLFSSVLFPLFVTMNGGTFTLFFQFAIAHFIAVMGISLFLFCALIALQGTLMAFMPDVLYRRVSVALRALLLTFFLGVLISALILPLSTVDLRLGSRMAGSWWPPVWFLWLFESCLSSFQRRVTTPGTSALYAIAISITVALLSFAFSYRRYFLRIPERAEGPSKTSAYTRLYFGWTRKVLSPFVRPGPEQALFQFILRTLLRSDTHVLFLGLWAGMGVLLALENLTRLGFHSDSHHGELIAAILAVPLILAYMIVAGLRFVFDIPAAVEANWTFRLMGDEAALPLQDACRKAMAVCVLPWILLLWFPYAGYTIGWLNAALAVSFDVILVVLAIELFVLKLPKIPFTCSFQADRDWLLRLLLGSVLVLLVAVPILVGFEGKFIQKPWKFPLVVLPALFALGVLRHKAESEQRTVLFEDRGPESFALLRLAGD